MRFINHLDVDQNQLLNAVLHNSIIDVATTLPGQIFYRIDTDTIRVRDAAELRSVLMTHRVLSGSGITATENVPQGTVTITSRVDEVSLGFTGLGVMQVRPEGISNSHIANNAAIAPSKIGGGAIGQILVGNATGVWTPVAMTGDVGIGPSGATVIGTARVAFSMIANGTACSIFGRSVNSTGVMGNISAAANNQLLARVSDALAFVPFSDALIPNNTIGHNKLVNTTLTNRVLGKMGVAGAVEQVRVWVSGETVVRDDATLLSSRATLDYVDALVTGTGRIQGAFDANAETQLPGGATIRRGDFWHVTVAGTVQTINLNIGDVIIAIQDNPTRTNIAHYIVLESNRSVATTTTHGWVRLATHTDMANRVIDAVVPNPHQLMEFLTTHMRYTGAFQTLIGNGTATQIDVTHGLGSFNVAVRLYTAGGFNEVFTTVSIITNNVIRLIFRRPPTVNEFSVVVIGQRA